MTLRVLDLFSGIGGFSLGLRMAGGFETVAFCEIDPYCRAVLRKHWPDVPIFEDVKELDADAVGPVDVIVGGYPCQPFSVAGKRGGAEDDRHLWPEMLWLVAALRPAWLIGENVAGHISMGLDDVLSDLEGEGYAARPFVIPACAVDAPHRRDRIWIVANTDIESREAMRGQCSAVASQGVDGRAQRGRGDGDAEREKPDVETRQNPGSLANTESKPKRKPSDKTDSLAEGGEARNEFGDGGASLPDAACAGLPDDQRRCSAARLSRRRAIGHACGRAGGHAKWSPEPGLGRVVDGIPHRVDRLKALGNAVVPQVVAEIGRAIVAAESERAAA